MIISEIIADSSDLHQWKRGEWLDASLAHCRIGGLLLAIRIVRAKARAHDCIPLRARFANHGTVRCALLLRGSVVAAGR
jgi:hypothetical protein